MPWVWDNTVSSAVALGASPRIYTRVSDMAI